MMAHTEIKTKNECNSPVVTSASQMQKSMHLINITPQQRKIVQSYNGTAQSESISGEQVGSVLHQQRPLYL